MMKKQLIALIMPLMLLAACTHPGGDIGIWFGSWHVESITCNGTELTYDGDYYFQFQSTNFRLSWVGDYEEDVENYGVWSETDNRLYISFPDENYQYLHMPGLGVSNDLTIVSKQDKRVELSLTNANGDTYVIVIKKLT